METEIGFINGMNIGLGFNTATNDLHPTPAFESVDNYRDIPGAGGQEVLFRVEVASSTESITEKLNVSARASLKYGMTGSGSIRTSFSSLFEQNSYTIYVIVNVTVTNKQTLLDLSKVNLKQDAARLYKNEPDAFIRQFGDSFIYGLITGGEFIGVLEISSTTSTELREIRAALSGKASYGMWSGNASASFEEAMKNITSSYQMKATVYRQGDIGTLNQITPDQLIKDALEFPGKVNGNNGFPRSVLVIPYNHIRIPDVAEDKIPSIVSLQTARLEQLGSLHRRFVMYQNDLTHALDYTNKFPGIDTQKISEHFDKLSKQINKIEEVAKSCFSDPNKCDLPSIDLTLLENVLPPQIEKVFDLGTSWLEQESGWNGIWKRRGLSNIFDATWMKPGENDAHSLLTIYREGNSVVIIRKDNGEGSPTSCTYSGTIGGDGKTIKGTYNCHWVDHPIEWSATITY